jgi:hypothetical protein
MFSLEEEEKNEEEETKEQTTKIINRQSISVKSTDTCIHNLPSFLIARQKKRDVKIRSHSH